MGSRTLHAETTQRTRKALLDAVRARAVQILDGSIEADKDANPFLHGVPAILEALRSGQIECRVYDRDKFHAKAHITHAKLEVVGSQALVGSSNFTSPGLTKNIELNIQVQSAREVAQLQEWFEAHWNDGTEVTDAVIESDLFRSGNRKNLRPNFGSVFMKQLARFLPGGEMTIEVATDVFNYIYATLHSQAYRSRYVDLLKMDYPRLPLTGSLELFHSLARRGAVG